MELTRRQLIALAGAVAASLAATPAAAGSQQEMSHRHVRQGVRRSGRRRSTSGSVVTPVAFRANDARNPTGTSTTIAFTIPASVLANDYALVEISCLTTSAVITAPSGWSLLPGGNQGGTGQATWLYGKVLTLAEAGATATWTFDVAVRCAGVMSAFSGVDSTAVTVTSGVEGIADTSTTVPSVSLVPKDGAVVAFFSQRSTTLPVPDVTVGAPYTQGANSRAADAAATGNHISVETGYRLIATAGSYGGESFTVSNSTTSVNYTVILPGVPTTTPPPGSDPADALRYPAGAGFVDVTLAPYNAKGDGVTDDTTAIRQAILDNDNRDGEPTPALNRFAARTVYLPPGNYLVSDSLDAVGSTVAIRGAGPDYTKIRLKANSTGFGSAGTPKYVLDPGSALTTNQGNSGFANYVEDLTVEIGSGNPGAVGCRFDSANSGAMRNVVFDGTASGLRGISLETTTGPAQIRDVTVKGFDIGLYGSSQMPNNMVITNLTLDGQRTNAIDNDSKALTFENLIITNGPATPIRIRTSSAVTLIIGGSFTGSSGSVFNLAAGAYVYARDVTLSGYSALTSGSPSGSLVEWSTHNYRKGNSAFGWGDGTTAIGMRLPIEQFPAVVHPDPSGWVSLLDFGPVSSDIGPALERMDISGAEVGYLPYDHYTLVSDVTLTNLKRIEFCFSEVAGNGKLTLAPASGQTMVAQNISASCDFAKGGAGNVGIRNLGSISGGGSPQATTATGATGKLYLENLGAHANVQITRPISVWCRQMNREGVSWAISGGATVWLLGDNIETDTGRGTPVMTVTGSSFLEVLGSAWDNLGDATSYPRSGAARYQATNSDISLVISSLWRGTGFVGHYLEDIVSGVTVGNVTDAHLIATPARGNDQRMICPLYVSPP